MSNMFFGVIESRQDPLQLGRCQVRIVGLHDHDKTKLPTSDLPWAYPLQSVTSAAMNGIGQTPIGAVEGTWVAVMFRDEDQQFPIILGTIGGIPQKDDSFNLNENNLQIKVGDQIEVQNEQSSTITEEIPETVDSKGDPVTKPALKGGAVPGASAQAGIDALNSAMTSMGITGKYGRAAILGIVGGECAWVPKDEGYSYSAEALKSTFKKTFSNSDILANQYARWKGTRESFFKFVYAPSNNGSLLGNKDINDGELFFGRGFIQITGRYNYTKYAKLSGVDIVASPGMLNSDYVASAKVACAYFNDRVKVPSTDPSYFKAALKAIGGAASGFPKKESYYNYFLGEAPPPEQTDKSTDVASQAQDVPVTEAGLPEDRQHILVTGFSDPNMKYPLRDYLGEPDTNRLARGVIKNTIVEYKDEKRLKNITTGGGKVWEQPDIPYNAKYPFNKVTESESGHVIEVDDTPGNERIHTYHRKGTYSEIDSNGTQVNRIVGDNYIITERNGYIYIGGECNLTVGGSVNILVQADANIDIVGDTKINMSGKADINVASDMSLNVGGELKIKAGNIKIDSSSDFNVSASGNNSQTSTGNLEMLSGSRANIDAPIVHLANGAATAESSGLGSPITPGTKSTTSFAQLIPPPRNLEAELGYETPEENNDLTAKQYHEDRKTETTSDQAEPVEETEKPENEVDSTLTDCSVIDKMESFPDSFVLYTDKTGYKWTLSALTGGKQITPGNFSLGLGRGTKNFSTNEIVCNLKALCVNILGPLNEQIGTVGKSWLITSCYRNYIPAGGSNTSQHLTGSAVDISIGGNFAYKSNFDWATKIAGTLPFDQLLLEYRDPGKAGNKHPRRINWVHISFNNSGPGKKDVRTFLNDKTYSNNLTNLGV